MAAFALSQAQDLSTYWKGQSLVTFSIKSEYTLLSCFCLIVLILQAKGWEGEKLHVQVSM